MVTSILAFDPAWTDHEPSGVALLRGGKRRWKCVALSPSYGQFVALAEGVAIDWSQRPGAGEADVDALMHAATSMLGGKHVDLITIDMPIAKGVITHRRVADDAVSKEFGAKGCSTHSPTAVRPGELGHRISQRFIELGFPVAVQSTPVGTVPALAEVYPHPALLALLSKDFRYKYKVANAGKYWPDKSPEQRKRKLVKNWRRVLVKLASSIDTIDLPLPKDEAIETLTLHHLKRYEDALDALICAWVGVRYLAGDCSAYGDETAAIWVPQLPTLPLATKGRQPDSLA